MKPFSEGDWIPRATEDLITDIELSFWIRRFHEFRHISSAQRIHGCFPHLHPIPNCIGPTYNPTKSNMCVIFLFLWFTPKHPQTTYKQNVPQSLNNEVMELTSLLENQRQENHRLCRAKREAVANSSLRSFPDEQWPKPLLFAANRGLYYQLCRDYNKPF